jgi:serine/threonine protein kinase
MSKNSNEKSPEIPNIRVSPENIPSDETLQKFSQADLNTLKTLGSPNGFLYQSGYQYLSPLGRGGNSIVGLYQNSQKQQFAIKIIDIEDRVQKYATKRNVTLEEARSVLRKNVSKEAKLINLINSRGKKCGASAGLLLSYSVLEDPNQLYVFFISKPMTSTLKKLIPATLNDPELALGIICQLIYAVACLHSIGIVHGDLKPENIFVEKNLIKIGDFGESAYVDITSSLAENVGRITGMTPLFKAPEVLHESRTAATKYDLWTLGLIILELLIPNADVGQFKNMKQEAIDAFLRKQFGVDKNIVLNLLQGLLRINPEERIELKETMKTWGFMQSCRWKVDREIGRPQWNWILDALEIASTIPIEKSRIEQ